MDYLNTKTEKNGTVQIKLPLRAYSTPSENQEIELKLSLIEEYDILTKEQFNQFINALNSSESSTNLNTITEVANKIEINFFDKAEMIVCYLEQNLELINESELSYFADLPLVSTNNPNLRFHENLKNNIRISAHRISPYTLPRVRAKLAVLELAAISTKKHSIIHTLINFTPRYLQCDFLLAHFLRVRAKDINTSRRKVLRAFFENGMKPKQKIKYSNWQINYFYTELIKCYEESKNIKIKADRRNYLLEAFKIWKIPAEYGQELLSDSITNPSTTIISIMTNMGMIKDESILKNKIQPRVKKVFDEYPYLRACDPLVEQLIDYASKSPEFFYNHDIWGMLEDFDAKILDKSRPYSTHYVQHPSFVISEVK